jgi:hypothetical protein
MGIIFPICMADFSGEFSPHFSIITAAMINRRNKEKNEGVHETGQSRPVT